jgi:nitrite reductase/ring-hydroxylating ferredoxin subunit
VLTRAPSPFPVTLADEQRLDRRRFLGAAGAALLLVAAGEWLARRLAGRRGTPPPIADTALAGLAPGDARAIPHADGETLAVRLADGRLAAFDRRCPHLGCPVIWAAEHGRFECPCHHAAFDAASGRVLYGPPRTGLIPVAITSS